MRIIYLPVETNHPVEILEIADSYREITQLVEGPFESLNTNYETDMWVNEIGKITGLPHNTRAQILFEKQHGQIDIILGPAVVTGGVGPEGETLGLSPQQIERIAEDLGSLTRVTLSNNYVTGEESQRELLLPGFNPSDTAFDIDTWFDELVFPHTGDKREGVDAVYTAEVISHSGESLSTQEWMG